MKNTPSKIAMRPLVALMIAAALSATTIACGSAPPVLVERDTLRVTLLSLGGANVYIIDRNGKRVMIDAGNPGDEAAFEAMMAERGIAPESIDYLILTHGHNDHAGVAAHFQKQWGTLVIGGAGDQDMIHRKGEAEICPTDFLAGLIRWARKGIRYPSFDLDIPIEGDFDLAGLGIDGQILHLPGHTPGSIVVRFDEHVFVGDLIRGSLVASEKPATHFFMCDLVENRARIRELLSQTGIERWHPGHMGSFDADAVRAYLETQPSL